MKSRGRLVLGGFFVLVGMAGWGIERSSLEAFGAGPSGVDAAVMARGHDLRLSAILLAVTGLVLLGGTAVRALLAAGFGTVWALGDWVLDRAGAGSVGLTIAAVVVTTGVAALAVSFARGGRDQGPAPRHWLLIVATAATLIGGLGSAAEDSSPLAVLPTALRLSFAVVGPLLLAAALAIALCARDKPSWRSYTGAGVVVLAVVGDLLLLRGPASIANLVQTDQGGFDFSGVQTRALLEMLPSLLVLAAAVAIACGRRSGWSARLGLAALMVGVVLASIPVRFVQFFTQASVDDLFNPLYQLTARWAMQLAVVVVFGIVLAATIRLFVRDAAGPGPAPGRAAPLRVAVGALLALAGAAGWGVSLAVFGTAVDARSDQPSFGGIDTTQHLVVWVKDVRWAGAVVAIGGLLLLVAGSAWRGRIVAATVAVWTAADVVLDLHGGAGFPVAAAEAVGAAALMGAAVLLARRGPTAAVGSSFLLVYSGIAGCFAVLLCTMAWEDVAHASPPDLVPVALVLSALLMAAAVTTAASIPGPGQRPRVVAAIPVGLAGGTAAVLLGWYTAAPKEELTVQVDVALALVLLLTGLVVALAFLGGAVTDRRALLAIVGWAGLAWFGMESLLWGGMRAMGVAMEIAAVFDRDLRFFEGWPALAAALTLGVLCGLTALAPKALSGQRPAATAPPPPPTPVEPVVELEAVPR